MTDPFDAASADPGDPLNWRELHKGSGGGGGHRHHTAKASHGLKVTRNPDGSFQVTKGIKVKGTPDYVSTVIQDLTTINSTKNGHDRMDRIDNSGKQVTIQNYDAAHPKPAAPNAGTIPGNNTVADYQNAGAPGTPAGFAPRATRWCSATAKAVIPTSSTTRRTGPIRRHDRRGPAT